MSYSLAKRCAELQLQKGSSGTWVVSEGVLFQPTASRVVHVHGMLVADDYHGDIYMIPLAVILEDIKNVLGVSSVSLPHDTNDIKRLLQLESFSLHDNATHRVSSVTAASEATSSLNTTNSAESASVRAQSPSSKHATEQSRAAMWCCSACSYGPMFSDILYCPSCGHLYCLACSDVEL